MSINDLIKLAETWDDDVGRQILSILKTYVDCVDGISTSTKEGFSSASSNCMRGYAVDFAKTVIETDRVNEWRRR